MELKNLYGVGPKLLEKLQNINIYTLDEIVEYYPYKYNFIRFVNLNDTINDSGYVECLIISEPKLSFFKKNLNRLVFSAKSNDIIFNVTIFNRQFLKQNLFVNKKIFIYGKYNNLKNTFAASDIFFDLKNNTISPIYHLTSNLTQKSIAKLINNVLEENNAYKDFIPEEFRTKYHFLAKKEALKKIHNPNNIDDVKQSKLRLIYEEFFTFMFKINYLKITEKNAHGIARNINDNDLDKLINTFPYQLTADQLTAINEIKKDMFENKRMNRLLLGDVGSGKTTIAECALYLNYLSNYQSAFMVPTEILAIQHYKSLQKQFAGFNISIDIITGKMTKKEKNSIIERLKNGEINILIGTHSLLNENLVFKNLGLIITDEQHRFGVLQRNTLENKGNRPDVLYLSATPIPRTYALTLYGDTDISIIKSKPNGRKEIETKIYSEAEIKNVLQKMKEELQLEHQIFIVSPLIENEESSLNSVKKLKEKMGLAFPNERIEIIHGKMKQEIKNSIMNDYVNNQVKILISTTVIEVGIDVPNATIMTIFNAERFGLATLHQLRGRVGRGNSQSYCFLISDSDNKRLKVMEESNDGFYITEKDFEQRREGDLFGTKQSGDMVFKIGSIKNDYQILLQTQKDSEKFITSEGYKNNDLYIKIINDLTFIN